MSLMTLFNSDMAIPVEHSKFIQKNKDTGIEEYIVKTIRCRIDGSKRYLRNEDGSKKYSNQTYITTEEINVGDKLDNQYVNSVKILYDFDGEVLHYEASVG